MWDFMEFDDEKDGHELAVWKGVLLYIAALAVCVLMALYYYGGLPRPLPPSAQYLLAAAALICWCAMSIFMITGDGLPYPLYYEKEGRRVHPMVRGTSWIVMFILCLWLIVSALQTLAGYGEPAFLAFAVSM